MSVDYNPQNQKVANSKKSPKRNSNRFFGVKKGSMGGQKPGARTLRSQTVTKGGGQVSAQTIKGVGNLHLTQHNVPVNTKEYNDKTVWKGGGQPSRSVVQAKKAAVAPC